MGAAEAGVLTDEKRTPEENAVERAPATAPTFLRAPAGSLESILRRGGQ